MLQPLFAIIGGLVAHHGFFIRGEWHMSSVKILSTHAALGVLLFWVLRRTNDALADVFRAITAITGWYLAAFFASMTVYRLFFHATSGFPGPKLAAVTKFWHIFYIRDSRNFRFLQRMHEKYGQFVRTGKRP